MLLHKEGWSERNQVTVRLIILFVRSCFLAQPRLLPLPNTFHEWSAKCSTPCLPACLAHPHSLSAVFTVILTPIDKQFSSPLFGNLTTNLEPAFSSLSFSGRNRHTTRILSSAGNSALSGAPPPDMLYTFRYTFTLVVHTRLSTFTTDNCTIQTLWVTNSTRPDKASDGGQRESRKRRKNETNFYGHVSRQIHGTGHG